MPGILSNSNGNKFKTVFGLSSFQTATTTVTANQTDLDDGDDELLATAAASSSSSPPTKSLKSLESNRSSKSFASFKAAKSLKSSDRSKDSNFQSSPLSSWNKSRSRGRKLRARIIAPQDNRAAELDSATPTSTPATAAINPVTSTDNFTSTAGPAAVNTKHKTPNKMPSSIDIRPSRLARPVRMDAQDGPWSVSVAEAPPRAYTIYIKTPTHHLTLTRSAHEISELHGKIQDQLPAGTVLPVCPLEAEPPQKRKSSFLTTLSRLASPPRQLPTQLALSQDEDPDPFLAAEPSATSSLASYLTTLSNEPHVRVTRSWKRFVRVRTDDLESTRVERTIKRVRSDVAVHTGGALSSTAPPSSRTSNTSADQDHPKSSGNALSGHGISEEDEGTEYTHRGGFLAPPATTPDDASAEENAMRLIDSGMVDFSLPTPQSSRIITKEEPKKAEVEPEPQAQPVQEQEEIPEVHEAHEVDEPHEMDEMEEEEATEEAHHDEVMAERRQVVEEHPTKIPRSMSADPDKAAKLARVWKDSSDAPAQSENEMDVDIGETPDATDAEDTDAFAGAMSDGVGKGKESRKKQKKQKKERKSKKVTIDDFEMMRVLGKGCAGKVLLVRYKRSEGLYALKAITKRHVLAHQELQHTMTEQAVLKRMARSNSDPFVVKLYWSFHDKENLFLVMDFHPGGDLATQLARWGRLGRDRARFYAAEIVEGCEGLHAAGVIYRDLKPENILIGGDGHIVLTDFGLSKEFPRRRPTSYNHNADRSGGSDFYASSPATPTGGSHANGMPYWMNNENSKDSWLTNRQNDTTTTFCGTAEYLAPEVIQGLPYSYEVDWWSFGTMLYEMLTGITPFWANNHSDMYVRVLQDELTFPEDKAMDQDTKSLIRGLLQRNPALRLCEPRIKRHPYFSMIDWSHVCHKRYIPPYIPPIDPANASDTQNFDETFLEMEPVLDTDLENDDQTGSERDRSTTDIDVMHEDESGQDANGDSHAGELSLANDAFDGYSFKARNSVLIDDEEGYGGTDESEEEEPSMAHERIEEETAEEELEAGQKTPDAHAQGASSPTPASAVADAFRKKQDQERAKSPTSPKAEPEEIEIDEEKVPSIKDEEESAPPPPKTPQKKANELPARSAPASPEKQLPKPPASENVNTAAAHPTTVGPPPTPPKTERKTVTIHEKPKSKPLEVPKAKPRPRQRRERSGVAALDRDLSDVAASDEETPMDHEDDDWDFIEALEGEENNGQQGKSLFARGVVDRYRLKVFRKPSTNALSSKSSSQRNPSSTQSVPTASETEFGELSGAVSPTLSDKKRGRGGGISLRKPRTFLRPKSPPATYSGGGSRKLTRPALATTQPATISSGSGGGLLLTPAASTPMSMTANGTSLKSQPSMQSVGSPGSSDNSINGTEFSKASLAQSAVDMASRSGKGRSNKSSPDLRRQAKNSTPDVDDPPQKGLKKMRKYTEQGAEKVMSLFSSPRPSQTPIP